MTHEARATLDVHAHYPPPQMLSISDLGAEFVPQR